MHKKICIYAYENNGTLVGLSKNDELTNGEWKIYTKTLTRKNYLTREKERVDQISISIEHSNPLAPGGYCIKIDSTFESRFRAIVGQEGFPDTIIDLHAQRQLKPSKLTVIDIFNLLSEINRMIERSNTQT